jgi:hypothetical protein
VIDVGDDRNVPNILAKRHSTRVAARTAAPVDFGAILCLDWSEHLRAPL